MFIVCEKTLIGFFALVVPKDGHTNLKNMDHWYMCSNVYKKKENPTGRQLRAGDLTPLGGGGERSALGEQWQSCDTQHGEVIRYLCGCRPAVFFSVNMCLGFKIWQYVSSKTRLQPTTNAKVVTPAIPDAPGSGMYRCLADDEAVLTERTKLWRCSIGTAAANNASPSAT